MSFSAPSEPNAHYYKFTCRCLYETPTVGALGRGFARSKSGLGWPPAQLARPRAHICVSEPDFIITLGGELALTHTAAQSLSSINLGRLRLEDPRGDSLGPQSSREPPRSITLFPEGPVRGAPTAFPFGLRSDRWPPSGTTHVSTTYEQRVRRGNRT